MGAYKMIILNLFYLPIVLSGYYWGRSSASLLALLCVLSVAIVSATDSTGFVGYSSPVMVFLSLTVWGAVLGLTALLVGTLCDERAQKLSELHEAYVGVAEVLHNYLQSCNTGGKTRSVRVADLSQNIAEKMELPRKDIDDIRVGVLLCDLGNIEITTQLISKAIRALESSPNAVRKHTFLGTELVHSLGSVLHNLVPLLVDRDQAQRDGLGAQLDMKSDDIPFNVQIIRTARAYYDLIEDDHGEACLEPHKAIEELRNDTENGYNPEIIDKLQQALSESESIAAREPVSV
jgi:response regulator RpfG family c-di-GMP phosphodiesterase